MSAKIIAILEQMIDDPTLDDTEYEALYDKLMLEGKTALRPLMQAMSSMDDDLRYVATEAFSRVFASLSDGDVLDYLMAGDDERLRSEAAYVLGLRGRNTVVEALMMALRDPSAKVRCSAAKALGMIGDKRAADALAIAQEDLNAIVRQQATIALVSVADWRAGLAFAQLVADTENPTPIVREGAVEALGMLEDERALTPILRALQDDSPEVRTQAARALIRHPDRRAIEHLNEALSDPDIWVRYYASQALYWIEDAAPRDDGEMSGLPDIASLESELVDEDGPLDIEALLRHLKGEKSLVKLRAIERLGEAEVHSAARAVIDCLYDTDIRVQRAAAKALLRLNSPLAADVLVAAASNDDPELHNYAARALYQLGDARVQSVQMLIEQDLLHRDPYVRAMAAGTLGMFGDAYAVDQLVNLLSDRVTSVRVAAVNALSEIGDRLAVEPLIIAADDSAPDVRAAIAEALGVIGEPDAFETLMRLMRDDDSSVRHATAHGLRSLGDPRAVQHLVPFLSDKDPDVCTAVAAALQELVSHDEHNFIDI